MNRIVLTPGALIQALAVLPQESAAGVDENRAFSLPPQALAAVSHRVQAAKQAAHESKTPEDPAQMQALMALLLPPPAPTDAPLPSFNREHIAHALLALQAKGQTAPQNGQALNPEQQPEALPPQLQPAIAALPVSNEQVDVTPAQQATQLEFAVQDLHAIAPEPAHVHAHARAARRPEPLHAVEKPAASPLLAQATFAGKIPQPMPTPVAAKAEQTFAVDTHAADWGEKLTGMLKESIHFQLGQREQVSTIRLDPPSLGKLEIAIALDAGKLTVHIGASQADVCRTLTQLSDTLRAQLTEQNFVQVEVQVSAEGQSQQQGGRERQREQEPVQIARSIADENSSTQNESVLIKV